MRACFSICSMYRDHAVDLQEWVEFHLLMGAERFFLYDNGSTDDHLDVLAPYMEEGVVQVHDWPPVPGLLPAMADCLGRHRYDSRWIAFLDIDEFLYSPSGDPLPMVMREYERWPAVGVMRYPFGMSGHERRPPGLVIENYLRRATHLTKIVKSIVDPTRVDEVISAHHLRYLDGQEAVDELKRPLDPEQNHMYARSFSAERLRINHYITKSAEEWRQKLALPSPDLGRERKPERHEYFLDRINAAEDRDILRFVPALREAIDRRNAAAAEAGRAPLSMS